MGFVTSHLQQRHLGERRAPLRPAAAAAVRQWIASRIEGERRACPVLGEITLMPHQAQAVSRLQALLDAQGGALLADDAGLGKTFVALALAAAHGSACVVAPASLRAMWQAAAHRAQVGISFFSTESLSRGHEIAGAESLVVVDEAHHFRNRAARRWNVLAARCAKGRVLLVSATPLHNRERELRTQLALFLGERAFTLAEGSLQGYVVRRTREVLVGSGQALPRLDGPHWLRIEVDEDAILAAITKLPPPVPAADGGLAGALVQWTLVRQWSSSRAALLGALRRRAAQAIAMRSSLDAGVHPTRRDLALWQCGDGAMQLAFPELLGSPERESPRALLEAVRAHEVALAAIVALCHDLPDPDPRRAAAIRDLRARHPGATIIAFAERAETVQRLWALLRGDPGVAVLTARGGEVAGGPVTRSELLARTAPLAQHAATPSRAERVSLLLSTDLLSEGVNLQDASVVVHLDLPWSPARLEQRVGRVRRLESQHLVVSVWAFPPPTASERLLEVERRLREKLTAAGRLIGHAGAILPGFAPHSPSAPEAWSSVLDLIQGWRVSRSPGLALTPREAPLVSMVSASTPGALALVERDGVTPRLVALDAQGRVSSAIASVAHAARAAAGPDAEWSPRPASDALCRIERSLVRGRVAGTIGITAVVPRLHRALGTRIDQAVAGVPRHERASVLPLAAAARRLLAGRLSAGAERVLAALLDSPLPPAAWLRAIAAFAEASARAAGSGADTSPHQEPAAERVTALIVFRPTLPSSPA